MKLRTRTCAAAGCQHVISARLLMCADHWRMVPAALRREIVSLSIRGGARSTRSWAPPPPEGVAAQYREAVASAVATVKEKQERKVQAAAGQCGSLFNT